MSWTPHLQGFENYLKLERSLSKNTVNAYLKDVEKLSRYAREEENGASVAQVDHAMLQGFIRRLHELGLEPRSQARVLSGVKAFFKYLLIEKVLEVDPSRLLETPKIGQRLPVTLSIEEVGAMIDSVDRSATYGERDRAILETLYGCGLRVSEAVDLLISNLYFAEGFIRVTGKGDKERLVPIGGQAIKQIDLYRQHIRVHQTPTKGNGDHLFLNSRGAKLSRVSMFHIVKKACERAGIKKTVSPHTMRHSFATHLVQGGADLRAIQEMLGHESITTTEIYAHLDRDYLRESIVSHHPLEGAGQASVE